jgi:hypothetical protein
MMKQCLRNNYKIWGKWCFVTGFAANSVSDAAKVLIKISIKGRNK